MTSIVEALGLRFADLGFGVYKASGQYEPYEIGIMFDYMPDSPNDCIVVTTEQGETADTLRPYDELLVQIRLRGLVPLVTRNRAQQIYDDLHGLGPLLIHGVDVQLCVCRYSGPIYSGRDETKRHVYLVDVETEVANPNRRGIT